MIRIILVAYLGIGLLIVLLNLTSEIAMAYQRHRLNEEGIARFAAGALLMILFWPVGMALAMHYQKQIEDDVRRSVIDGPRWQRIWNEPMPKTWKCPACCTENVIEAKPGDELECGICRHHWIA